MLPYYPQPIWHVGPLPIHAFGVTVAAAMWLGLLLVDRRIEREGLDQSVARSLGGWMLLGGAAGAHMFAVLAYFPGLLHDDPWLLLRVWEHISSFGGMLGGLTGALCFFAIRTPHLRGTTRLAYLDAIAMVFPAALAVGRLGCTLAHDHPGGLTTFPLAFSLHTAAAQDFAQELYGSAGMAYPSNASSLGFHDLGFYELLFLTLVVVPLFRYWNRQRQPVGFYLVAFAALYLPVRFCLDMLRIADVRYLGLTPAQWVAATLLTVVPFFAIRHRTGRFALAAVVVLGAGWACVAQTP